MTTMSTKLHSILDFISLSISIFMSFRVSNISKKWKNKTFFIQFHKLNQYYVDIIYIIDEMTKKTFIIKYQNRFRLNALCYLLMEWIIKRKQNELSGHAVDDVKILIVSINLFYGIKLDTPGYSNAANSSEMLIWYEECFINRCNGYLNRIFCYN